MHRRERDRPGYGRVRSSVRRLSFAVAVALALTCIALAPASASGPALLSGVVEIDHADVFGATPESSYATFYRILDTGTARLRIDGGAADDLATGAEVTLRGERQGGRFVLAAARGVVSTSSTSSAATAVGNKRLAVLLANFTSDLSQP